MKRLRIVYNEEFHNHQWTALLYSYRKVMEESRTGRGGQELLMERINLYRIMIRINEESEP